MTTNALSTIHDPQSTDLKDRLVTLSDGRSGLRGTISTEVLEPSALELQNLESGIQKPVSSTLDFISSDETLDRYDEVVSAKGWKLLHYQRNPVFQNSHQYGDIIHTLGRALTTEVRNVAGRQVLYQRVHFATDVNPMAKLAFGLYKGKFLNAVSVGFVPLRWENGTQETAYRRKYLEQELLEVSAVSIPANPNALALAYKSGAVEKSDIRELSQLLRSVSLIGATPEERQFERLFRLASTINALLKRI